MPLARDAIRQLAEARGGCTRPVQLRRTDITTGQVEQVLVPCGATLEHKCRSCADRAKSLRAQQCREGWHLEDEPDPGPPAPGQDQEAWLTLRAQAQVRRDHALAHGDDTTSLDELIGELDDHITDAGIRGCLTPATPDMNDRRASRRSRSTRRRQDTPDLPKRPMTARTTGRVFEAPDGKRYRPSMFLTLTCDSYGKVGPDGTPADPARNDYQRAARDALHFAALFDRLIQNLRRYLGYDLQYFAAIEPQKRLAPHVHLAIRGTVPRADLRQVIAATYHQVWWPSTNEVRFDGDQLPVWHEPTGSYIDPATGEVLPTWDQALDAIGPGDEPVHVARFGPKLDAQGVLGGSKDSARCIGYLTKYLTKQLAGCHTPDTDAQAAHVDRLVDALRYEPCSPGCANWLRYGIQPDHPRPGMRPGHCKGKAHRREHLGYAGRRVLVSRKWSGKTLADHRGDRQAWLLATLDLPAADPGHYTWERVIPADHDHMPPGRRLLHVLTDRARWQAALTEARRRVEAEQEGQPAGRRAA
ncbi:MAG: helitron helicase-like domain-containing protein [Actinomycetota bacterium]|nr:helitron helicase-like domain-containing protein [Actinomycetota bacterium]